MSEINLNPFFAELASERKRDRERKFIKAISMTWCDQCAKKHDKPVDKCISCGVKLC